MKYLAFDLEVAFNFSRISTDAFLPEDGERVLLAGRIINEDGEKEEVLVEGHYVEVTKEFRLTDGSLVPGAKTYWAYQGNDWKRFEPLGITCAAAASSDGELWNWHAQLNGRFISKMTKTKCQNLVRRLAFLVEKGYIILTWNGLGFDFKVLARESGMFDECKELALNHIDMMFHFLASKGFALGLDAAAKGMGLPGKPEGMDGAKAPELWPTDPHKVLAYCSLDTTNTLTLAEAVDTAGHLDWTARSGRPNSWQCSRWLTVKEAMELPLPDTSWMTDPWPREKFYKWTEYEPVTTTGEHYWDIESKQSNTGRGFNYE